MKQAVVIIGIRLHLNIKIYVFLLVAKYLHFKTLALEFIGFGTKI